MNYCPALALLKKECQDCVATIHSMDNLDKNTHYQLTRLGICKGCPISVNQKTIFSDPIVFTINNSNIAIRRKVAGNIDIAIEPKF